MVDTNSQLHGAETPYTHEKRGHEDILIDYIIDYSPSIISDNRL